MKQYNYQKCPVLTHLTRSETPLISKVELTANTALAESCFDYKFSGESKFFPFEVPNELKSIDFKILVITGASGSGKSTFIKNFDTNPVKTYKGGTNAIISEFATGEEAADKFCAVGLASVPVWCKPRNVLSVGEGFRADVALNFDSGACFDEFTSTVDRNVAISLASSVGKAIKRNNMSRMIFCSCHKDYIDYMNPDYVVDLDDQCVYNCVGQKTSEIGGKSNYEFFDNGVLVGKITL